MIPLLAPLLGSLAGSLLPATLGSGIAGALGLKGAAGAFVASAAPKAIGAGIGTLLAGGDLGDAALNAVGFGAAGALLGGAGSTGAPATSPRPTMRPDTLVSSMPAPAVVPTAAPAPVQPLQGPGVPPATVRFTEQYGRDTFFPPNDGRIDPGAPPPPPTVPSVAFPSVFSGGISSLPGMNNGAMLAGMSPNQSNMVNEYLRSRNMVGFA
jgi:hypothetical protein